MNINLLIHRVKTELGIGKYLKIETSDAQLKSIITDISIPDFSSYFKNTIHMHGVFFTDRDPDTGIYTLPTPPGFMESAAQHGVVIKGIREIRRNPKYTGYAIGNQNWPTLPNGYHRVATDMDTRSATSYEYYSKSEINDFGYKCQFVPPNKIKFLEGFIDYSNIAFDISFFTSHSNNLSTLGNSIERGFIDLVKLDFKRILYNKELKFIDGLETTSMTVNLKIEDWATAEADRAALLKDFEESRISTTPMVII